MHVYVIKQTVFVVYVLLCVCLCTHTHTHNTQTHICPCLKPDRFCKTNWT